MGNRARLLVTTLVVVCVAIALWYEPDNAHDSADAALKRQLDHAPLLEASSTPRASPKAEGVEEAPVGAPDGAGISIRVEHCDSGAPVAGVLLAFVSAEAEVASPPRSLQDTVPVLATTDEEGQALMPRPGAPGQHVLAVAPGFLPATIEVAADAADGGRTTICLAPGARIRGRVVDPDRAPIQGAEVRAVRPGVAASWPNGSARLATVAGGAGGFTRSREDGSFEVSGLSPDTPYDVLVKISGYTQGRGHPPRSVAGSEDVVVTLLPQAMIRIRFIDDETGERIVPPPDVFFIGGGDARPRKLRGLEAGEMAFTMTPYKSGPGHDLPEEAGLVATRHGYERVSRRLRVPWRTNASMEVRLKRSGPSLTKLRLSAAFEGGEPYSGALSVTMSGTGDPVTAHLRFVDGRATETVSVPPGRTSFASGGGTDATQWYWRSLRAPVTKDISLRPEEQEAHLTLRGQRVRIEARDAKGRRYEDYEIHVQVPDGMQVSSGWYRGWTTAARSALRRNAGPEAGTEPGLWLPPGRTTLTVNVPEVGSGEVVLDLGSDGGDVVARVELTKPPVDHQPEPVKADR